MQKLFDFFLLPERIDGGRGPIQLLHVHAKITEQRLIGQAAVRIPSFLQEAFGKEQHPGALVTIFAFGAIGAIVLFASYPAVYEDLPLWRSIAAFMLVFDILCGCAANFTESTSNYYAANPRKRIVFICVHVHILLIAVMLELPLGPALAVWLYTIACASGVNANRGRRQLFLAGVLLAAGVAWMPVWIAGHPFLLTVSLLFMLKVVFSFGVDHYRKY
ncbi:hypothetical protein [Paenibacillus soyae]|uniref:Uncharacterized protein n=1 Tax=Paenibacillus soyae TaxID=2969249 RepID=A0A9X2MXX6_9BACL|nr:hypothetical protein [Paenibacillus soyae]MCR2807918.1 hypothetical protein [Paenibacillus soyae]